MSSWSIFYTFGYNYLSELDLDPFNLWAIVFDPDPFIVVRKVFVGSTQQHTHSTFQEALNNTHIQLFKTQNIKAMDPKLTEVSQLFDRFKAAFLRNDFDSSSNLLSQLKVFLTLQNPNFNAPLRSIHLRFHNRNLDLL